MPKLRLTDILLWVLGTAAAFTVFFNALRLAERFWQLGQLPGPQHPTAQLAPAGAALPRHVSTDEALRDAELQDYAARGLKIHAIKRYRELTGAGLKEAKDTVELRLFTVEG